MDGQCGWNRVRYDEGLDGVCFPTGDLNRRETNSVQM